MLDADAAGGVVVTASKSARPCGRLIFECWLTVEWLSITLRYRGPETVLAVRLCIIKEKVMWRHVPLRVGVTISPLGNVSREASNAGGDD